jgi:hypothetical protein
MKRDYIWLWNQKALASLKAVTRLLLAYCFNASVEQNINSVAFSPLTMLTYLPQPLGEGSASFCE